MSYPCQKPPSNTAIFLFIVMVLALALSIMCVEVQGQTSMGVLIDDTDTDTFHAFSLGISLSLEAVRPDSLESVSVGFQGGDQRKNDTEYWYFEWDGFVCAVGGCGCMYGTLYRRLDRWYLDTVQVCDTVVTDSLTQESVIHDYWGCSVGSPPCRLYKIEAHCHNTTIYVKRETETKWVIPGESK